MPVLVLVSAGLIALFFAIGLPAAVLLGSMGGGIAFASRGGKLAIPQWLFRLAQAAIGLLMARSFTPTLFRTMGSHVVMFGTVVISVLLVATLLGVLLARMQVLPGSTALWGAFPGAASVMVVMSEAYGADMRLVAFMQYLRVVAVAVVASIVGRMVGAGGAHTHPDYLGPVVWSHFAVSIALIGVVGFAAPKIPLAAGALLISLVVGTALQNLFDFKLELPPLFLAATYLVVGWTIGLRFTQEILRYAARALPRVMLAIGVLIAICAGIGVALGQIAHLDPLTAYFATSPGGADSIAILAQGSSVNVALVMAIQMARSLAVMFVGPTLARYAARWSPKDAARTPVEATP